MYIPGNTLNKVEIDASQIVELHKQPRYGQVKFYGKLVDNHTVNEEMLVRYADSGNAFFGGACVIDGNAFYGHYYTR